MSAVAKLNELLFENSDKIPEGLYLELMNLTKDVFTEKTAPVKEVIKYQDFNKYHLNRIERWVSVCEMEENPDDIVKVLLTFIDASEKEILNVGVGEMVEIVGYGYDQVFWEIEKINSASIWVNIHIFNMTHIPSQTYTHYIVREKKNIDKLFGSKHIIFYDLNHPTCEERFFNCLNSSNDTIPTS